MTELATSPAAERTGVKRISHWIGGRPVAGTSGRSGPVFNPATGRQTGEVDFASVEEVDQAVQAAKAAFPAWRAVSLAKRAELFFAIRELVAARREEVARLLVAEHGKVLSDALGEVTRGLEVIEFACGIPTLLKGEFSEQASTGVDVYSIRQPLGVVAGITPFNFPAMVPDVDVGARARVRQHVRAQAVGEGSVGVALHRRAAQGGRACPDGVFNVVHGDKVAVDALLEHPDIAAVSFVGSTPIARYIYETATAHGKRVPGARRGEEPHDRAAGRGHRHGRGRGRVARRTARPASAAWRSRRSSRSATSAEPLIAAITERIAEGARSATGSTRVGDGAARHPRAPRQGRRRYIETGRRARARRCSSTAARRAPAGDGFFLGAVAARRRHAGMDVYRDEIFGPVLGVMRVATYDEARAARSTTTRTATAPRSSRATAAPPASSSSTSQAGMVGINVPIPVPVAYYSFGGWKASLFGDRHIYGPEGIDFYTRGKVVTSRWPDPATSQVDLGFPQTR